MSVTLYTAPDCIRCKIVKKYLADNDIPYEAIDFKADAEIFNKFYRTNRKDIYRNPDGVEFPLYQDEEVIRQGSGEILAWLLAHGAMGKSVTRSDLLHGKISGLYPDFCPKDQEANYLQMVQRLADGGLGVTLQTEGRNPGFLKKLLEIKGVTAICNVSGGPEVTEKIYGSTPTASELADTAQLVLAHNGILRFLAMPIPEENGWRWPDRKDAAAAAKMLADACSSHTLPFCVTAVTADMGVDLHGLAPLPEAEILKYRSAAREFLFKAAVC